MKQLCHPHLTRDGTAYHQATTHPLPIRGMANIKNLFPLPEVLVVLS